GSSSPPVSRTRGTSPPARCAPHAWRWPHETPPPAAPGTVPVRHGLRHHQPPPRRLVPRLQGLDPVRGGRPPPRRGRRVRGRHLQRVRDLRRPRRGGTPCLTPPPAARPTAPPPTAAPWTRRPRSGTPP